MENGNPILDAAIRTYFGNERLGMYFGVVIGIAMLAGAAWMMVKGDSFARGLALVLAVIALGAGGSSVGLAIRDSSSVERLVGGSAKDLATETVRMARVVANYPYYRYFFLSCTAVALLLFLFASGGFWQGLGAGLLFLAALGIVMDHYDAIRAMHYLDALTRYAPAA
jgi:uncharacterized membrane protein